MLKRLTLCGLLISNTVLSPFVYAQDVSVVDGQVETTEVETTEVETTEVEITEVEITEVEITEAVVDQITEPVVTEQTMTPTNVNYVPQTTVVAQTVPTIYKEIEQVENKPIGTLKRLGVSDPSKPVGKLTRLMQILPETGSLNGDTGIITGVVMLMSAIILSLYGFAKRIFN